MNYFARFSIPKTQSSERCRLIWQAI